MPLRSIRSVDDQAVPLFGKTKPWHQSITIYGYVNLIKIAINSYNHSSIQQVTGGTKNKPCTD
jgi:hypothetical protein